MKWLSWIGHVAAGIVRAIIDAIFARIDQPKEVRHHGPDQDLRDELTDALHARFDELHPQDGAPPGPEDAAVRPPGNQGSGGDS